MESKEISQEDVENSLGNCREAVQLAEQTYSEIVTSGIPLDSKSNDEHVQPLLEAIDQFEERAEL